MVDAVTETSKSGSEGPSRPLGDAPASASRGPTSVGVWRKDCPGDVATLYLEARVCTPFPSCLSPFLEVSRQTSSILISRCCTYHLFIEIGSGWSGIRFLADCGSEGLQSKTSDDQQEVVLHAAQTLQDRSQAAASITTTSAEGWLHSLVESENLFSDCKVDWPGMTLQSLPGSFVVVGQAQRNAMHRSCVPAFLCLSEARTVSGAGFPCSGKPRCRQSPRSGTWTLELEGGREDRPRWQVLDRKRKGKKDKQKAHQPALIPRRSKRGGWLRKLPKGILLLWRGVEPAPFRLPRVQAELLPMPLSQLGVGSLGGVGASVAAGTCIYRAWNVHVPSGVELG
jgi:hypothetical protein